MYVIPIDITESKKKQLKGKYREEKKERRVSYLLTTRKILNTRETDGLNFRN